MATPLEQLAAETYVSLETFKKDGTGVKTPVWAARVGDALYVVTDGTSYKVKRLRRNPRTRIAGCNGSGSKIRTDWFEATGTILEPGPEWDAAHAALGKKYGIQYAGLNFFSRLGGRMGRRAMLRFDVAA